MENMKNMNLFDYPNKIQIIFNKLDKFNIRPIIVGGYIRDFYLASSKKNDIDIELYGVTSYELLEEILQEFGDVNTVGKSFGVCKLFFEDLDLDFTLPRTDSKISSGHAGFLISINKTLSFKEASSRRDFTINSIGFDVIEKKILDPYNGLQDIKNKILKAVDIEKFSEDPLRVLRLVSFKSRLDFHVDKDLFKLCKTICNQNILSELAQERVYIEIKKVLLVSKKPSLGFFLLKELGALKFFQALDTLNDKQFSHISYSLDRFIKTKDNDTNIQIMLSILCFYFNKNQVKQFISNLTSNKHIVNKISLLIQEKLEENYTDSQLYHLANRVNIEYFLLYWQALNPSLEKTIFEDLKKRAKKLNILNKKVAAFIQGRDILALGIKPSKEYARILSSTYEAQMNLEVTNYGEAIIWLKKYLLT